MSGRNQQKDILMKHIERQDIDDVREKLDFITWLSGWHEAVRILRSAIAEQSKVDAADIDRLLSSVFNNVWSDTSDYSYVLEHLSNCPNSDSFDDILEYVKDSMIEFPKRSKQVEKKPKQQKDETSTHPTAKGISETIEVLTKAIELDPKCGLSWALLGDRYLLLEQIDKFEDAFLKVQELEPELLQKHEGQYRYTLKFVKNDPKLYYAISVTLRLRGKKTESKKWFDMAIDKDIAYLFLKCDNFEIAEKYARRAVKRNPGSAELQSMLAFCLEKSEKIKLAEKYYRKALSIDSRFPFAWLGLSSVLKTQEKIEEAEEAERIFRKYEHRTEMYFKQ